MNWERIKLISQVWTTTTLDPDTHRDRLKFMELNLGVPVKLAMLSLLAFLLFFSSWFEGVESLGEIALGPVRAFFGAYLFINIFALIFYAWFNHWSLIYIYHFTLVMTVVDGLFLSAMVVVTGGLDSMVYWVFLVLMARNAISIPIGPTQITVNLISSLFYTVAIAIQRKIMAFVPPTIPEEHPWTMNWQDPFSLRVIEEQADALFVLRVFFLLLMTALCYGVQVLFDRERANEREQREYILRREQLRSTGRLAAEIAHRLKNPLAIINNTAYSLRKLIPETALPALTKLEMIREEVEKSDLILTELMGYSKLSEGSVERLDLKEELEQAVSEVFPAYANFGISVKHEIPDRLPPLMMQRQHLREIIVNVLVNAREASRSGNAVRINVALLDRGTIEFRVSDEGEGIAPDRVEKIFEAYYTTKEKGTGLGLAIVRQNLELYGGTIQLESVLGKGAAFIVTFPSRTL